jgi:hypothetical protein
MAQHEPGRFVTLEDGRVIFIRDSAGSVPQRLGGDTKKRFSKSELQKHIVAHHNETTGGGAYTAHDEKLLQDAAGGGNAFTFYKRLPTEIKEFQQGRPELRSMFHVTENKAEAGGADAFGELGDKYLAIAEAKAGSPLKAAVATAHASDDPEVKFLAHVHDNLPAGGGKLQPIQAGGLRVGDQFTVNGEKFRVAEDEHGFRVLHSSEYSEEVPVDALNKVPIDRGSFRPGKAPRKEAIPFSANNVAAFSLTADGEGSPVPMGLAGYPTEADGVPIFYRKVKVGQVGKWTHRGTGEPFEISPARADEWVRNTKALSAAGVKPFIPGQHREEFNAADNFGYVEDVARDGDDLYAVFALYGDGARKAAAVNSRSLYVVKDAIDAKGNVYPGETITHIALVPNPALPNLGGTLKIAASASGGPAREVRIFTLSAAAERSPLMKPETIAKLRAKLNLAADVKDEDVAERAAALALADPPPDKGPEVVALSAKVKTLETERDAIKAEAETLKLSAASAPPNPDGVTLAMYQDVIGGKRESAVAAGTVSEARAKEIDALLADASGRPTPLALSGCGSRKRPLAFELWDLLSKPDEAAPATQRKVNRKLSLAAGPNHQSYDPDAKEPEQPITPERRTELLAHVGAAPAAK